MLLYYITDRAQFSGPASEQQRRLLDKISECASAGVDYIQLREKDLSARALEQLAHQAMAALHRTSATKLLINSRTDIALACGAHGVHVPANDLPASEVRKLLSRCGRTAIIGVSAHSFEEVIQVEENGADFAVFAPVFEKAGQAFPGGLEQLRRICSRPSESPVPMPVLALGGITLDNARSCLQAGAGGIAAIRLFQENHVARLVSRMREI